MLHLFTGTDREKTRTAIDAAVKKAAANGADIIRITDAHTMADLYAALEGGGMFGGERVVVLDGVLGNAEMGAALLTALPRLKKAAEPVFILEEKMDAATRKQVEKYSETFERFDIKKEKQRPTIFSLADALQRGEKKKLWVGYQRELQSEAPEAIHGVLFWGAKQALLAARTPRDVERASRLVARLAELPHEARRRGVELEYALERFVLSGA